jgi:CBS domain-containing protein
LHDRHQCQPPGHFDWPTTWGEQIGELGIVVDAAKPAVGEVARRDVAASVVVNERRVVLGLLRGQELDADPAATAEQVMQAGPTTYRPNVLAREAGARMRARGVDALVVTTPDGTLVGLLRREDAEGDASADSQG